MLRRMETDGWVTASSARDDGRREILAVAVAIKLDSPGTVFFRQRRLGLGEQLYLGEGEAARGGRRRPSLLASAFEAVAGALGHASFTSACRKLSTV